MFCSYTAWLRAERPGNQSSIVEREKFPERLQSASYSKGSGDLSHGSQAGRAYGCPFAFI
jgi:hypothetical protein